MQADVLFRDAEVFDGKAPRPYARMSQCAMTVSSRSGRWRTGRQGR